MTQPAKYKNFWFLSPVLLLCFLACSGEDDDDGADDDTTDTPTCDPGFVLDPELPDEFLQVYPDGCVPEGCGIGTWGSLAIDDGSIHVDALADADGDGTADTPFDSIRDGLDAAGDSSATIVVAAGTYQETVSLNSQNVGTELNGRCQELVVLDASEGEDDESGIEAASMASSHEWSISGLTITGANYRGISLDGGHLIVSDCAIINNRRQGIFAKDQGSLLSLVNVNVKDTQPIEDGTLGRGIDIENGAVLEAENCTVENNAEFGLYVYGDGSTADINTGSIAESVGYGVYVGQDDATVVLSNVEVKNTMPTENGIGGWGIIVDQGATLDAENCLVEGNIEAGVVAFDQGTTVLLSDVEVSRTRTNANGRMGRGMSLQTGAYLDARGCLFEGNTEVGVFASGTGTTMLLTDVEVRDTKLEDDGTDGRGINIQEEAHLEADACQIIGNADCGVLIYGPGTTATLSNMTISETVPDANGTKGRGIEVVNGASLEVVDCLVTDNSEIGIFTSDSDTTATVSNTEVRDTRRETAMTVAMGMVSAWEATLTVTDVTVAQTGGPGLFATGEGNLFCTNCELVENGFAGAVVWGAGKLDISGSTISGTTTDANEGGGIGVYASDHSGESSLVLDGCTVESHPLVAVWLDGNGSYSITNNNLEGGDGLDLSYPDGSTAIWHGDGIVAVRDVQVWDGSSGLLLNGNTIHGAYRSGVFLDGSSADLVGNTFSDNATDLVWQRCDGITQPSGMGLIPNVDSCPSYNLPVAPLEFNLYMNDGNPLKTAQTDLLDAIELARAESPVPTSEQRALAPLHLTPIMKDYP